MNALSSLTGGRWICTPSMSCLCPFLSKQTFDTFSGSAPQCLCAILGWQLVEFISSVLTLTYPHCPVPLTASLTSHLTFCPQRSGVPIAASCLPVIRSICLLRDICSNHPATGLCSFTLVHASRFCFLWWLKDLSCLLVISITSASIF